MRKCKKRDDIEMALNGKIAPRKQGYKPQAYFDAEGEIQFKLMKVAPKNE